MMKNRCENLSSIERRPSHTSLTHFLRRNWLRNPFVLQAILSKCTVAPYVGALPPELRARVPREKLAEITYEFRMRLEDFLIDKIYEIRETSDGLLYYPDKIGELFNTRCVMEFGATNYAGYRIWTGLAGIVCKMSFPELNAKYALKIFDTRQNDLYEHGAMYEIPTAFAAAHAAPRDTARVYMASFIYEPYMLSRWEGDVMDGRIRKNKNEIFVTSIHESESRNYRHGRRIDFGETFRTAYGAASYRVRKMCRKIIYATQNENFDILHQIAQDASVAAPASQKEYCEALDLASIVSCHNIYEIFERVKSY